MCRKKAVPQEQRDAFVVPIPKKGDLSSCDNWWGIIVLLDLGGQLFAKIIQQRVQSEGVLPESQCGFQSGRGCVDDILWPTVDRKGN